MNAHDENGRVAAIMARCYRAVQTGFPYLALKDISEPPRQWFDAKLARQIAIHIAVNGHHVPRRRIAKMYGRNRARSCSRSARSMRGWKSQFSLRPIDGWPENRPIAL